MMAGLLGATPSVLSQVLFAQDSSKALYRLIESFKESPRRVRELKQELEALNVVLQSLQTTISHTDIKFTALELPLRRCGKACKGFQEVIVRCSRPSFRDWAKLAYMGDDIAGFKNMIADYKSTITIALADANIRAMPVNTSVLNNYKELIKNTKYDLEEHLQQIDQNLFSLLKQGAGVSRKDEEERLQVQKERQSALRHLEPDYDKFGYRIVSIIDRGGYGIVTKVQHCDNPGVLYARKQLSMSSIKKRELMKEVALIREAEHRHVVKLVSEYEDNEWFYIVMLPFATGNLQQYLHNMKTPKEKELWADFATQRRQLFQWIYCLAVTLEDLHIRNIRHRDIKPENILVNGSEILFTDFGISFSHDGLTKVALTTTVGSERYEPPEAFQENGDDTLKRMRTGRLGDVFSLGCVVFEMLGALSEPVLSPGAFPQCPSGKRYSNYVEDHEFLSQASKVKEHRGLSRRLPDDCRFSGLTEALLGVVISAMMTPFQDRKTTADVVDLLAQHMKRHYFPFPDCCVRPVDAVVEDRPALSRE